MNAQRTEDLPPIPESARKRQIPRWLLLVLVWISGIAIALAGLEWLEWPFLRAPIESALQRSLGRNVTLGAPFGIRFIGPLRLRTDLLVIGPAPDGPTMDGATRDLFSANALRVAMPYSTLFSLLGNDRADKQGMPTKGPLINELEVAHLEATLLRKADGQANWRFGSQDKKDFKPLVIPEFKRLLVKDGTIRIDDALGQIRLDATMQLSEGAVPTPGQDSATGLEIIARGSYRGRDVSGRLHADSARPLLVAEAGMPPVPLQVSVRAGLSAFEFEGKARNVLQLEMLDGQFHLKGSSLAAIGDAVGVTLPTTASFTMRGRASKDGNVWSTDVQELLIGTSRLKGSFRYDPTPAVPKLTGQLGGVRLAMADLGPAVGTMPPGHNKATPVVPNKVSSGSTLSGARVLPQREFDIPSLSAMDADVAIALDEFALGTAQLENIRPFRARLLLDNRTLALKEISAQTANGELRGMINLDARHEIPLWNADLRWSGVLLDRFVKARDIAERQTSRGYINGTLGGYARLRGSGRSTAGMLATLDGEAKLWIQNGKISHFFVEVVGLDIAQALGMLVRGDDMLPMQCAVSALGVHQGKINTEVALIETTDSTLSWTGTISLADERLDLVFKSQPKDISPLALRSPVFVEGTFADPVARLDRARIGVRAVAATALAAIITPLAGMLALVDLGEPEKEACLAVAQRMQNPRPNKR